MLGAEAMVPGREHSGPLRATGTAMEGDLESLLSFPEQDESSLGVIEQELFDRLNELRCRERKAEELAAEGRPFIG